LTQKFRETLDVDIEALLERVSPLGFKLAFDLPKAATSQEVEKAVEEADQDEDQEGAEEFKAFETSRKRKA